MSASVTASGNVAANAIIPIYINSSIDASASVTIANLQLFDPNFANVSLLLHGNGANGSTTFTDSSSNSLSVSANGNAQIDTTIKQFGTGSMEFDGTGDFLTIPDNAVFDVGSNNFTIEGWIYPNTVASRQIFIYQGNSGGQNSSISYFIEISSTSKLRALICVSDTSYEVVSTSNIVASAWTYFAFVRNGTTINLYIDGTSVASTSVSTVTVNNSASSLYIGSGNTFLPYNGYIDDLRITKGVARYTSNFTKPSREFLDQ